MKALSWQIISVLLAVLLIIAVQKCSHNAAELAQQPELEVKPSPPLPADTFIDSFPYPVYIDTGSYTLEVIREEFDSTQLLELARQYFSRKYYDSVYKNDSDAYLRLSAEVSENRLEHVNMILEVKRQNQLIIRKEFLPMKGIYAGVAIVNTYTPGWGPALGYVDEKYALNASYDFRNKGVNLSLCRRIWKPRKIP